MPRYGVGKRWVEEGVRGGGEFIGRHRQGGEDALASFPHWIQRFFRASIDRFLQRWLAPHATRNIPYDPRQGRATVEETRKMPAAQHRVDIQRRHQP